MNILEKPNWKYEISFNNDLYRELSRHSFLHTKEERRVLDGEIEWFRHHFTFQQFLDGFSKLTTKEEIENYKTIVYKRRNNLIYLPKFLYIYYRDLILKNYKKNSEFLLDILKVCVNKKCRENPAKDLYKLILGDCYKHLTKKIKIYSKRKIVKVDNKKVYKENIVKNVTGLLNFYESDVVTHGIFGRLMNSNLRVTYDNEQGAGELKSCQLYVGNNDSFNVNSNHGTITINELNHSFYFNVYPGKAHFFNTILPVSNKLLDMGASFLINGWALFTTWHVKTNLYTRNSKTMNGKITNYLLKGGNWKQNIKQLYLFLLNKFPQKIAMRYIIDITGYPTKYESYILGGLATEYLIDRGFAASPMDLLKQYRKKNLGDFFSVYLNQPRKYENTKK